jgi:hypothetical protein
VAQMVVKIGSAYRILVRKLYEELLLIRLRRISNDEVRIVFYSWPWY